MPKVTAESAEKRLTIPGLPGFLEVGNPARVRSARTKIGPEQLRKLFEWWSVAQPAMRQVGATAIGIPVLKLAQEFGLSQPTNGNSFRANLQRHFDQISVDGKTMFLSLRGADGDKFRVTEATRIYFHPVPISERRTGK